MKLLFITGLYPQNRIDYFREKSKGSIQNAPNVFQWAIVDGLERNNIDFHIVSYPFIPSFPCNYKSLYVPKFEIISNGSAIGRSQSFCTLAAIKEFSIQFHLKRYILDWIKDIKRALPEEEIIILTYSDYSPFLNAVKSVKKRYPDVVLVSIITDMLEDMLKFNDNNKLLKRVQTILEFRKVKKLYKTVDKFVLLTSNMADRIPEAKDKYCVIEGIAIIKPFPDKPKQTNYKTLLYTGTLQEFSGVRDLLQGFMLTQSEDYRLVICGKGVLTPIIESAAQKDKRIIYKGLVSREEVLSLQEEATVLINPRKPDNEITRYSFPSKTMEYLTSGTPMIGYKLEGIPNEYYQYFYCVEDLSTEALAQVIDDTMSLPISELKNNAKKAYDFIIENKTSAIQVRKLINFISQ